MSLIYGGGGGETNDGILGSAHSPRASLQVTVLYALIIVTIAVMSVSYLWNDIAKKIYQYRDSTVNGHLIVKTERQQYDAINDCVRLDISAGKSGFLSSIYPVKESNAYKQCGGIFSDRKLIAQAFKYTRETTPFRVSEHAYRAVLQYNLMKMLAGRYDWTTVSVHQGWFPAPEPVVPDSAEFNRREANAARAQSFIHQCKASASAWLIIPYTPYTTQYVIDQFGDRPRDSGFARCLVYFGWKSSGQSWDIYKNSLANRPELFSDAEPAYPLKPAKKPEVKIVPDTSPRALYRMHLTHCAQEKAVGQITGSVETCAITNASKVARMTPEQFKAALKNGT